MELLLRRAPGAERSVEGPIAETLSEFKTEESTCLPPAEFPGRSGRSGFKPEQRSLGGASLSD